MGNAISECAGAFPYVLVRDAAAPAHPIIGLIALTSSAVQIAARDEWIGWNPEQFVDNLRANATETDSTWLRRLVQEGLEGLYMSDLLDPARGPLTLQALKTPSSAVIAWLETAAQERRDEHQRLGVAAEHKRTATLDYGSGEERWSRLAVTPLFASKRAAVLAMLLRARLVLGSGQETATADELRARMASPAARQALQSLVRSKKRTGWRSHGRDRCVWRCAAVLSPSRRETCRDAGRKSRGRGRVP